ncbi:hypothetical protein D9M68_762010 [compost metagenome]
MMSALICWYSGLKVGDGAVCGPVWAAAWGAGDADGVDEGAGEDGEDGCVPAPGVAAPESCAPGTAAPERDVDREDIAGISPQKGGGRQPDVNCLMSYIRHMN